MVIPRSHYEPVDSANGQIRLLVLYPPTKHSDTIYCQLKPASISSNPNYEALSYTWGNVGKATEIRLGNQQFQIRENLAAALQRLRHPKKERRLWIDAICINQNDPVERAAQVLLMRQIFNQASQVCVWLGELGEGGIAGMNALQSSFLDMEWHMWKINKKWGRPMLSTRKAIRRSLAIVDKSNLEDEFMEGEVRELLSRPWWRRTWVVQEAVVASKLVFMCGPETTSWESVDKLRNILPWISDYVQAFGIILHERSVYLDAAYQTISGYRQMWQASPSNISILDVLYRFRSLECEDPRDRIFAFLGIAPSAIDMGVVPDYNSSLSQVYFQFALTVIRATGSLDILNCKREWRDINPRPHPEQAYSLLDQSRYYDVYAEVIDGPDQKPRRAWARLPDAWERIPRGKMSAFLDHRTGKIHDTSPLEGQPPKPAEYVTRYRSLSPGWHKKWDNLGRSIVQYQPEETEDVEKASRQATRQQQQSELSSLPSWVPNWATPTPWDPAPLIDFSQPTQHQYRASGNTKCSLPRNTSLDGDGGSVLPIQGIIFDTITHLAPAWHPETDIPPISRGGIDPLAEWETLAHASVPSCPYSSNSLSREDVLFRTLLADYPPPLESTPTPTPSTHTPLSIEYLIYLTIWSTPPSPSTSPSTTPSTPITTTTAAAATSSSTTFLPPTDADLTSKTLLSAILLDVNLKERYEKSVWDRFLELSLPPSPYHQPDLTQAEIDAYYDTARVKRGYGEMVRRLARVCAHRRLFVTDRGYIGLAGWDAREDDRVVVFDGGATPFVVRPREFGGHGDEDGKGECFELVGEAYVYGIMGGDVMGIEGLERRVMNIV